MQQNKGRAFVQELSDWLKTEGPKRRAVPSVLQLKPIEDWMNIHLTPQELPGPPPEMQSGFREMRAARGHLTRALPRLHKAVELFKSIEGLDCSEAAPELLAVCNSIEWFLKENPQRAANRPERMPMIVRFCNLAAPAVIQAFQDAGWKDVSMKRRSSIGPGVVARMMTTIFQVDVKPAFVVAALREG